MNENRGMAVDSSMDSVKEDEMFSFLGCMEDEGKHDVAEKRREERKKTGGRSERERWRP